MMPTTYNEQAPVPPPSYSRAQVQAQAQRARALHINALTLIQTLHLLALGRAGGAPTLSPAFVQRPRRCATHLPRGVLAADRKARKRCGSSPTRMCMIGWRVGPRWPWPVACRSQRTVSRAFLVLLNGANAGKRQAPRSSSPSFCSRCGGRCAAA